MTKEDRGSRLEVRGGKEKRIPPSLEPRASNPATLPFADDLIDAVSKWQGWLRFEKRAAANTVAAYQLDLHNLLHFVRQHRGRQVNLALLAELKLGDFRSWLAYLAQSRLRGSMQEHRVDDNGGVPQSSRAQEGLQAASRARAVAGARSFFRWLDRSGQLHNGAIEMLKLPKSPRRLPRPVSEADAEDIVGLAKNVAHENWIGLRDEALFTLLYGAGLRIGEALALVQTDLAVGDRLTVTGKGNKQRQVPLLPVVREALQKYRKACPYVGEGKAPVFVGARGEKLNPAIAQRQLRALRRQLNLPDSVTPHALRHSFASHLLTSGADLRSLQELLGHSSLSTTQLYTKIDATQLAKTYQAAHPRAKAQNSRAETRGK